MKAIGMLAIVLAATTLVSANAQNGKSTQASNQSAQPPANPDAATKKDLQRLNRNLTETVQRIQVQESEKIRKTLAQQAEQAETQRKATVAQLEAAAAQREAAVETQRKIEHAAEMRRLGFFVAIIGAIFLIGVGAFIVLRDRKVRSATAPPPGTTEQPQNEIPELPENANPTQIRTYAIATEKIGATLDYVVRLEKPDPKNPVAKIFIGRIAGKVHYAGTPKEFYQFGAYRAENPKNRFKAAQAAFDAQENTNGIHQVSA